MKSIRQVRGAVALASSVFALFTTACAVAPGPGLDDEQTSAATEPLRRLPTGFCMANCQEDDYQCKFDCMSQQEDTGPGGGGGQSCRPSCGQCKPDGEGGSVRTCIDARCETYEKTCKSRPYRPGR
jgi:hypothetical protein